MREMTKVTEVMMTEEEREEMERELSGGISTPGVAQSSTPGVTSTPHAAKAEQHAPGNTEEPTPRNTGEPSSTTATSPPPQEGAPSQDNKENSATEPSTTTPVPDQTQPASSDPSHPASSTVSEATTPGAATPGTGKSTPKDPRRRAKLTTEQKQKIDAIGEERDKAMEKRVEELTEKLKDVSRVILNFYWF
jgi:hypothetical protein